MYTGPAGERGEGGEGGEGGERRRDKERKGNMEKGVMYHQ